ncbi:MAG: thioredoxin domain-containing protein [Gemmatimonadaceae bacterium]
MTANALVVRYRRALGAALLLLLGLGGWQAVAAAGSRRVARSPLAVGTVLGRQLRSLLDSLGLERGSHGYVLLYVADACAHCRQELARWDSLVATGAMDPDRLQAVLVIAPSRPPMQHLARFPHLTILDRQGTLASALNVRVVPLTYWLDRRDQVRAVTRGQQLPADILRRYHAMLGD